MNRTIFLLNGDDELVEMRESSYDSEDLLQRLLARYPTFLAGDQIDRASPRRWLLRGREVSVPGEYGAEAVGLSITFFWIRMRSRPLSRSSVARTQGFVVK